MTADPDQNGLWQAAKALDRRAGAVSPRGASLPPLLFFTDPGRTPDPTGIAAGLPEGASVVYRGFGQPVARDEARALRRITRERGLVLLIGQDEALAEAVGADGLHLPERDIGKAPRLRDRHPGWLLTAAWHGSEPAPMSDALDALVLSPVFQAGGTSAARPPLGVDTVRRLTASVSLPVYGLGGITADNAHDLADSGLCGLAAIEGVLKAFGPSVT